MNARVAPSPELATPAKQKALIDELAGLFEWHAAIKDKLKRMDDLKKLLVEEADRRDASRGEIITLKGNASVAVISAANVKREITDLKAIHSMLGDDAFYALATMPLTAVDNYLTPEQRAGVLAQQRTGPRTVKVVRE